MTKQNIIDALRTFLATRPGFDPANYGDRASYLSEMRQATRQRHAAELMLRDIELLDSITWQDIFDATRGGRIDMQLVGDGCSVSYTAGQYYPLEYRAAVARLASSVLWAWKRDKAMPQPEGFSVNGADGWESRHLTRSEAESTATLKNGYVSPLYGRGLSASDWLRASFIREYGRGIASRYFS